MPDSCVDVYLVNKEEGKAADEAADAEGEMRCFENIAEIFKRTADEEDEPDFLKGLVSEIFCLNTDFYVSVDIQAFSCLPKRTAGRNPI